ncbi:hypothetical protein GCM10009827_062610 [Dactylosporangium maewongense]|uniref:Uncharacterized protein n=1 Tax=Dactylosporangium maewongense TaxID=634393 RepID=A0ABP4M1N3_9ACTN
MVLLRAGTGEQPAWTVVSAERPLAPTSALTTRSDLPPSTRADYLSHATLASGAWASAAAAVVAIRVRMPQQ